MVSSNSALSPQEVTVEHNSDEYLEAVSSWLQEEALLGHEIAISFSEVSPPYPFSLLHVIYTGEEHHNMNFAITALVRRIAKTIYNRTKKECINQALAKISHMVSSITNQTLPQITEATTLKDIGLDSLDMVQLILLCETHFDISFADQDITKNGLSTFGDLALLFCEHLPES